jgi:tetratricopeptide (TPR) repeat protein
MRRIQPVLFVLVVSLLVFYSCKSVETTSAMLHNQHKNYTKAIEMATLALEKNPNDAEAHFQLGISYSYTGRMRDAYEEFMTAARLSPDKQEDSENNIKHNWAKHFNNGVSEYQVENFEGASKEFELATQADPRQVKGWLNLAKVYNTLTAEDSTYIERAYSTVDTLLTKTQSDDENYGSVLALSGQVMIRRGMEEEAVGIFEKLMLDDPANFETVEEVGVEYLDAKNYNGAATFFEMAVSGRRQTESENFDLYYNLGVTYYNLGMQAQDEDSLRAMESFMKAIDAYQNARQMRPDDRQVNYSLLLTYYQAGFYDEAIAEGQRYTEEIAPEEPRGWQILSLSYNKRGMKIKAEEAFQKYRELTQ